MLSLLNDQTYVHVVLVDNSYFQNVIVTNLRIDISFVVRSNLSINNNEVMLTILVF